MLADRAYSRSLLTDHNVATLAANPDTVIIAREHDSLVNIGKKLQITLLMSLLDCTDLFKKKSDIIKTLLLGRLGHFGIHIGPLILLARRSIGQIHLRVRHIAVMQQLKPYLGMSALVMSRFFKDSADLLIAILLGLLGIETIFDSRL